MATDLPTISGSPELNGADVTWGPMANGDVGGNPPEGIWTEAYGQVTGTFGVAGSVQLEGSEDNINWYKLSPAALTSAGTFGPLEAGERPRYLRPHVTAGDGTTALTVIVHFQ